ncbi:N(4)-acetylcytidine aminohydrolase [Volucribacter amazonae]|uniref:N(4)-acetylcytidine amidohydrolase n=1 Tax=Volucribacter amazonae TaxID=256731 RepID=A0A9X4PDQ1_9PAST|nr:N(4)-acetylcytidine aminohydrolase [Volucribacter amazonae]MDG6895491.1 ASCH domain-containing protein [Volucribacter amazonae]
MMTKEITFFTRFKQNILNGSKTITIRDITESHYQPNSIIDVYTLEQHQWFAKIKILSVTPIQFEQINQTHAQQENMDLITLKQLIREIYPNTETFYVIHYQLII